MPDEREAHDSLKDHANGGFGRAKANTFVTTNDDVMSASDADGAVAKDAMLSTDSSMLAFE